MYVHTSLRARVALQYLFRSLRVYVIYHSESQMFLVLWKLLILYHGHYPMFMNPQAYNSECFFVVGIWASAMT